MKEKLKVLDLFSGIGGFSLGLERTGGFETVAFCEIEEFPRKVLNKHWPEVPIYEDITKLTGDILKRDGISVDVITGGFPCQDISTAGKLEGIKDGTRSGLWSEITRLIGDLRPRFVVVENVANLLSGPGEKQGGWFSRILADLAGLGYDAEWESISAESIGAPHPRNRVWIIAYPKCEGWERLIKDNLFSRRSREAYPIPCNNGPDEWCKLAGNSAFIRNGDGLPVQMERNRLKALGNSVVPQIPELIGYAILEAENNELNFKNP